MTKQHLTRYRVLRRSQASGTTQDPDILRECVAAESFIEGIEDSLIRMAIEARYIDGLPWKKVAERIGSTGDAVRKAVERFLSKQTNERE